MKTSKKQLEKIIKEEIEAVIQEDPLRDLRTLKPCAGLGTPDNIDSNLRRLAKNERYLGISGDEMVELYKILECEKFKEQVINSKDPDVVLVTNLLKILRHAEAQRRSKK